MNLKFRFALLFTSFVAVILIISSIAIYVLYYNFRVQDFYRRVQSEGLGIYQSFMAHKTVNAAAPYLSKQNKYALVSQKVIIFDSNYTVLHKDPDTVSIKISKDFFKKAKAQKEYYFQQDQWESVGLYFPETKNYVYATAFDRYGFKKLQNIKLILLGVLGSSMLLAALLSLFFVNQAFSPLKKLSEQMQRTTELSNAQRVEEGKGNDEIKQIARSYNAMIERLKKAYDYQKSFVNHASHELRTPLASMLSQTEAAFNKNLDDAGYRKVLMSLKEDQQEMIELTNSLLLLSQYEKMTSSNDWNFIRIDEVLYDTIKASKKISPDANITLEFVSIPQEENLLIKGNEALLRSAIRNLIKNACQYSSDKIVLILLEASKDKVEITVQNKGKLVVVEEREKLFIPFFRGGNSMEQRGHGLGLAIVQRIMDVHQGKIVYEALTDGTNSFILTLYK
ncbi:MAG: HAMP domain-containing histidine kinase [Chitinophagaceae bacterium]|nr:HAMP domain-containing histidine kinase [Chitinophagaceae bacterium]